MQINAFVLQRPPKPLNHPIVDPAPLAIHADFNLCITQNLDPIAAGELAALIGVEYLWRAVFGQRLFQCLNADWTCRAFVPPQVLV